MLPTVWWRIAVLRSFGTLQTAKQVMVSQPDILAADKGLRRDVVINMAIVSDGKIRGTEHETLKRYQHIYIYILSCSHFID